MANSFLSTASKKVTDVRGFLRESASGNSIKYVAEKGAKHLIYIPYQQVEIEDENGNKVVDNQVIAISGNIHEWQTPDGKWKSTICLDGVVRESEDGKTMLNDGSCPICDRVSDGWDIYRYRKEAEEATCKLTGEDLKKHMESIGSTYRDERKAKEARPCMYMLVVKFRADNGNVVMGQDNLPEYDLKVMKVSNSRIEKIQQQVANAGSELPGSEVMFEYPNTDDRRLQVSQSTTALVFPSNRLTAKYNGLLEKITQDVSKFTWEGIEKSFPEWKGMTTAEAKAQVDVLFEKWDEYKQQLEVNPNAKYMEYVTSTPVSTPSLTGEGGAIPAGVIGGGLGGAPTVPEVPDVNAVFEQPQGGSIQI